MVHLDLFIPQKFRPMQIMPHRMFPHARTHCEKYQPADFNGCLLASLQPHDPECIKKKLECNSATAGESICFLATWSGLFYAHHCHINELCFVSRIYWEKVVRSLNCWIIPKNIFHHLNELMEESRHRMGSHKASTWNSHCREGDRQFDIFRIK